MVYGFAVQAEADGPAIKNLELEQSVRRNFSGLDDLDPMEIFCRQFSELEHSVEVTIYRYTKTYRRSLEIEFQPKTMLLATLTKCYFF